MIIYPALDLRGGKVVRLRHGDPSQQTTYSDDPLATAQRWQAAGAQWLHVVNLDGALGESSDNLATLRDLSALGLHIQFGGGLRSLDDAAEALDAGAARIVLGTLTIEQPHQVAEAIRRFGVEAVVAALDAKDGHIAMHGWQTETPWTPTEMGQRFAWMGLRYVLFTDIRRDGDLSGPNVAATAALAAATGLRVIASGGVASLDDVRALAAAHPPLDGVVIGRALYNGEFTLEDALRQAVFSPSPRVGRGPGGEA